MNRLLVLIPFVWIALPMSLLAQDAPKVELFAGFPHLQGENSAPIFAAQGAVAFIDVPVHRRLAIRTQVDALRTRFADKTQHYTRASFGVVIPIGKRGYLSE